MPIEYLIDDERRVLEIVFLGAVTRSEIAAMPSSRCALVAPHDPSFLDLKLFEMWSSRGPREYRVFRSLGEACAWLGLDRAGLCIEGIAKT